MTDKKTEKRRALLSASDKSGIVEFAKSLVSLGWEIISTGGTADHLRKGGVEVKEVSEITGFPEILDGRVKTLHPFIHGGLLARRDNPEHMATVERHNIKPIDLVAVNLYPFQATVARPQVSLEQAIEHIDIGGPAMLRSAAKNHESVWVVVDPADYGLLVSVLKGEEKDTPELRRRLARKVYQHTASYDAAISAYFANHDKVDLPEKLILSYDLASDVRYGENPDDSPAAFYIEPSVTSTAFSNFKQLSGKTLSYNNIGDAHAAVFAASLFSEDVWGPVCAIIKHRTPCALATGASAKIACTNAIETDPESPFGGIFAFNTAIDEETAEFLVSLTFIEVVAAPSFNSKATEIFKKKPNVRLIEVPVSPDPRKGFNIERLDGGVLVQPWGSRIFSEDQWKVVTKREPTEEEWKAMRFSNRAAYAAKSNTMILGTVGRTVGIGAGQTSRVFCLKIAGMRADARDLLKSKPLIVAADAFLPAVDNIDVANKLGATAIIQPGGSLKDKDVIARADEYNMAMIFTGRRLFRH